MLGDAHDLEGYIISNVAFSRFFNLTVTKTAPRTDLKMPTTSPAALNRNSSDTVTPWALSFAHFLLPSMVFQRGRTLGNRAVLLQIALAGKRCSDQRPKVAQACSLAGSQHIDHPASLRCVEQTAAPQRVNIQSAPTLVVHTDAFKRNMKFGFISFA